ncbi:meiosis-specific protein ASY3-like [Rutidosis leptorrhynchoides]|uniref:meiosis-specific protein ASY3-like n=1 Tax=Rutidosis leptorrhynchoides TaxID=125765 RepID=UPI003A99C262
MSGNWSFGSNYHPSSQSRKMSIGIMVDSSVKTKSKNGTGTVNELQTSGNVTSSKGMPAERKQVFSSDFGKQNEAPLLRTSNSYQNRSYSNANGHPKVSNLPSDSNVPLQPSGVKTVGMEPGSYFANQMSILQATDANEKKPKNNTSQMEEGNHDTIHATPLKVPVPDEEKREQKTSEKGNSSNIALRLKVRELLGTICAPNEEQDNPGTREMNANDSRPKSTTSKNDSPVSMHKPPLDTIETNSESPDDNLKRPLTRSLTRKKPQAQKIAPTRQTSLKPQAMKVAPRKQASLKPQAKNTVPTKQASIDRGKQVHLDENAFSFVESWSKQPNTDVNQGFKTFKRKEREVLVTRPAKTCVMEGVHKDKSQQTTDGKETNADASNVSLFGNRARESEVVKPNTEMKEKTRYQFESNNMDQDSFAKPSFTKNADPQYDLNSPTFELKTSTKFSSPKSLFQTNQEDLNVNSPSETSRSCSSQSMGSFRGSHYNAKPKNAAKDLLDTPVSKPEGSKEYKRSRSPSKEVESESSEDDSPMIVVSDKCEGKRWSESPYQKEDSESSEDGSPIKGDVDNDNFDASEQDGLAGAVKLFALALERVQRRMHSVTSKQSAAILLSVSKNIHSQLQNAESKIQNDIGKLTSLGKSKRTHTENQYQEQQEQLKRIYEKFKEEVDLHLQKSQSTLEGLDAHQIQVRGVVEKQRQSHKKFIQQTEEAIEKQLLEAQTRIADVHRVAKEQMNKLKYGIAECLKEGLLG